MNRRSFLQSVTAALAYAFMPAGLRKSAPPVVEATTAPKADEPPKFTTPHDLRWAALPTAITLNPGQFVYLNPGDGLVTDVPPSLESAPVGVAMERARDGMVRVAISMC